MMIRHFPRRLCSGSKNVVVGRISITHQQRSLSLGFSNSIGGCYNHSGSSQPSIHIRQFGKYIKHEQKEEGDEITLIYGDRPDYESSSDKSKYTHEVKVEMPDIGDLKGGTIETWYKRPGDVIHRDDVVCDIRTEDFTFGMVTDDDFDSIMGEIFVEEESGMVDPGTVIFTTLSEPKHHVDSTDEKDE